MPRKLQKSRAFAALLTVCAAFIAVPSLAQTSGGSDIATYQGPDREQRLVEGAKKEGSLTFYSSIPVADINALTAAFEKKYGLKVNVWRADSEGFLQRMVSEAKARRTRDDFFPRASIEPDKIVGLDTIVKDAVALKYTATELTKAQLDELIQIPPR